MIRLKKIIIIRRKTTNSRGSKVSITAVLVCNGICNIIYHSKYIRTPLLHHCTSVQLLQCIHNHGGCVRGRVENLNKSDNLKKYFFSYSVHSENKK